MTTTEFQTLLHGQDYDFLRTDKHLGKNILFLTLGGSHAYGTNIASSDVDVRGVAGSVEILGFNKFEQVNDDNTDTVVFALTKVVSLLTKCNPSIIELLGNAPELYANMTPEGQMLLDNKALFLSKRAVDNYGGFIAAQRKRMQQIFLRCSEEQNATHLDKYAMHMVRLYYTVNDILERGQIINRRDREHDELMAIRGGKYHRTDGSYAPEFFEMVDGLEARFKRDAQETFLPEKPDIGKIEELLMAMNMAYLKRVL